MGKLDNLFTEWTQMSHVKPGGSFHLNVKFENSNGAPKELRVYAGASNPEQFTAHLFEGDFLVGDLIITFGVDGGTLGSYQFNSAHSAVADEHYAANEYPVMTDTDFDNFVTGFHLVLKDWAESQQA